MRRRDLLTAAGAGLSALAAPWIGRAEKTNKLVFVPTEDLGALDPVIIGIRSTRNHAYLVFDTLYGIDTSWTAQPQMVEGQQVDEDGLTWTLKLRDGLRFTIRSRCWHAISSPAFAALPPASASPMR
jgi:peptide/nickel transport system substrate-binding protein